MKKTVFRILLPLVLALGILFTTALPAAAATSANITVTGTPAFVSISIGTNTWTINGSPGSTYISTGTTYYSNAAGTVDTTAPSATVVDAECLFTVTNTSNVITDLTCNMPNFTGGDAMTNVGTGYTNNGANAFGASAYVSGLTWPGGAITLPASGASTGNLKASLAATTDFKFGIALKTQSGAWASGSAMSSTVTVAATVH